MSYCLVISRTPPKPEVGGLSSEKSRILNKQNPNMFIELFIKVSYLTFTLHKFVTYTQRPETLSTSGKVMNLYHTDNPKKKFFDLSISR